MVLCVGGEGRRGGALERCVARFATAFATAVHLEFLSTGQGNAHTPFSYGMPGVPRSPMLGLSQLGCVNQIRVYCKQVIPTWADPNACLILM